MRYKYYCPYCEKNETVEHGSDDDVEVMCMNCGTIMIKQISKPNLIFKGSGFYSTDYKNK